MKTFLMPIVTVIVWFLFKTKEINMNKIIAIVASVFALNAFAQTAPATPAPAKVEKKAEAKPSKSEAQAPAKSEPAKAATTK
jgi:hypothetical protein